MKISISEIKIKKGRRPVDEGKVRELADSIREIGLLNPITVTKENQLIAGAHRIAAYKLLGKTEIEATVKDISGLKAKLAEIDENLIRKELHYLDHSKLLAERKEIYEGLHPETKLGATGNKGGKIVESDTMSFSRDTAKKTGVSSRTVERELQLADTLAPEVEEIIRKHDIPKTDALKLARIKDKEKQRAVADKISTGEAKSVDAAHKAVMREDKSAKKAYTKPEKLPDDCNLFVADINKQIPEIADDSVDFIITDPPYPKEYIYLYGGLSELASRVLKPGGSLIVMCGQSYLPDVIKELCKNMTYHWCMAYLTPGGQSPQLWNKKTNTFWKPVLWLTKGKYKGDLIGDVLKSPPNDNDKQFHDWGQSLGGFREIIEKFTYPGQTILDPFLGGGTTGVAAVTMGRKFIGADIDKKNIAVSRERILEALCRK